MHTFDAMRGWRVEGGREDSGRWTLYSDAVYICAALTPNYPTHTALTSPSPFSPPPTSTPPAPSSPPSFSSPPPPSLSSPHSLLQWVCKGFFPLFFSLCHSVPEIVCMWMKTGKKSVLQSRAKSCFCERADNSPHLTCTQTGTVEGWRE